MIIVKAPRTRACCSDCGKTAALFRRPTTLEFALVEGVRKRLGTERVLRQRIRDMLASGHLLEVPT